MRAEGSNLAVAEMGITDSPKEVTLPTKKAFSRPRADTD